MAGVKGKSGGRKKPTACKVLEGTFRKDRAPANEPKPRGAATCPSWLSAEAKREWKRLAPELERLGLLTQIDQAAFAAYCQAWADFRWAVDFLKHRQRVVKAPSGYKQIHPVMTVRRQLAEQIVKLSTEFGMTPSARARVEGVNPTAPVGDSDDGEEAVTDRLGRPI